VAGTLWINAILMTILPLVVSKLVVSLAGNGDSRAVGQAGWRALQIVRSWQISLGRSVLANQSWQIKRIERFWPRRSEQQLGPLPRPRRQRVEAL
jgi:hypothetical protein